MRASRSPARRLAESRWVVLLLVLSLTVGSCGTVDDTGDVDLDVYRQSINPSTVTSEGQPPSSKSVTSVAEERSRGCDGDTPLAAGEYTFPMGDNDRRYVVHLPSTYQSDTPWPVLLALHPNGGDLTYFNPGDGGVRDLVAEAGEETIVVLAESVTGLWRDYNAPDATWAPQVEADLAYFDELVAQLQVGLCVDPGRIYSLGFSGGGSFAGALGCRRSYIRAFAAAGAVIYFDPAACTSVPSAWITIGTEELVPGRVQFRDFFVEQAACAEVTVVLDRADCIGYAGCMPGRSVNYCQHPGDHEWPSYANAAAWEFLRAQN